MDWIATFVDVMIRHLGQTVTIFTTSGGLSGAGFTGVLISVDCNFVRLLCDIGAAPACAVGSSCAPGFMGPCGFNGPEAPFIGNPLGSVAVIPMCAIASFTHHAI